MECAAVPYYTHVVLHGAGHESSAVVLENRHVDPFVTLNDGFVHLSVFEGLAVRYIHLLV